MIPTLVDIIAVNNVLGEGVIWQSSRRCLWWTDIESCAVYSYQFETKHLSRWPSPQRIGCIAPVENKDYLIVAFETGFAFFDPTSGWLRWLHSIESDIKGTRLNDGKTDRQGRFWAGSMVEIDKGVSEKGALYCLDGNLEYKEKISGLSISNGLCWSPDSSYMYHTDTPSRRIDRYDFDSVSAEISNRKTFVKTQPECMPDGATVDAEGFLWNAQWGGSQIVRYSPAGDVDLILPVPLSQPTCVAFGGPDLNLLCITSATQGLSQEARKASPDAGNLLIYETDFMGLPEREFRPSV